VITVHILAPVIAPFVVVSSRYTAKAMLPLGIGSAVDIALRAVDDVVVRAVDVQEKFAPTGGLESGIDACGGAAVDRQRVAA